MKKIIVFLLTAVLCLGALSVGMSAGDYVREGEHGRLFAIEKFTPKIDGELDPEYLYSDKVVLRDNGPEFATGEFYYLWDDEALYFHMTIHDSTVADPENATDHESDCIEMLFSLYNYDTTVANIPAKQPSDIGDAQFRVFRTKDISDGECLVDNGIKYQDGSHGGFGKWVYDNNNEENPELGSSFIILTFDDEGYSFEGFVKWSPDLKGETEDYTEATIKENAIIGLGIQVNDDNDGDGKRNMKCYADNSAPNDWSMSSNRATCGMFQLVNSGIEPTETEPDETEPETPAETPAETAPETTPEETTPETADASVIFALLTVVSAGGFTVCAAKKSKKN